MIGSPVSWRDLTQGRRRITRVLRQLTAVATLVATTGCAIVSASQHPGVTTVPQPVATEQDANVWFTYYQDQFDAFEGIVLEPPSTSPEAQRQGYQRAAGEWVSHARSNAILNGVIWTGIGLVTAIVIGSAAGSAASSGF